MQKVLERLFPSGVFSSTSMELGNRIKGTSCSTSSILSNELPKEQFTTAIKFSSSIRICSVKEVDAFADSKIEHPLKLLIHLFFISPKQLVPPSPCPYPHWRHCQWPNFHLHTHKCSSWLNIDHLKQWFLSIGFLNFFGKIWKSRGYQKHPKLQKY